MPSRIRTIEVIDKLLLLRNDDRLPDIKTNLSKLLRARVSANAGTDRSLKEAQRQVTEVIFCILMRHALQNDTDLCSQFLDRFVDEALRLVGIENGSNEPLSEPTGETI